MQMPAGLYWLGKFLKFQQVMLSHSQLAFQIPIFIFALTLLRYAKKLTLVCWQPKPSPPTTTRAACEFKKKSA
jgi:hypothetical protein